MDGTEDFGGGLSGHLIDGPCVRLTWPDKFRLAVRHKCEQLGLAEDDVFRVDGDLFGSGEQQQEEQCGGGGRSGGILHALSFEEFIRRLRGAEKNWVRGFKTWFTYTFVILFQI
jgi:hypothetical protein